jgi:hypothetical protein
MKLLSPFLLIILLTCTQCRGVEYALEMPDVTSTGEHTFGCYVNNELFIGHMSEGPYFMPGLSVIYYVNINILEIFATAKGDRGIYLRDTVVAVGEKVRLKHAGYNNNSQEYEYLSDRDDGGDGEILLTRLELDLESKGIVKGIVSGRFSFRAKSKPRRNYVEDSVSVTEGRFDLKIWDGDLYYGKYTEDEY